jgi:hypothetical protein
LILSVMRNANSPIGTHAIVAAIIKAGGHGPGARSAIMRRVRGNLAYLHRREKVLKTGSGKAVRWSVDEKVRSPISNYGNRTKF